MNPVFAINFRREAFQREVARTRARVIGLGAWLAYFGAVAVIFGLYGLNFAVVTRQTRILERQAAAIRAQRSHGVDWRSQPAAMGLVERGVTDARQWRDRLARLGAALPANARLTAIEFNPGGASGASDWNRLVVAGTLRVGPSQDRMRGVTELVSGLQRDSVLSRQFRTIRLTSTRITETSGSNAEFVVECRP